VRKRERNRLGQAGGGRRPEREESTEREKKRKENSGNKLQKKAFLSFFIFIFREKEFV
jgi:hypothetical protein